MTTASQPAAPARPRWREALRRLSPADVAAGLLITVSAALGLVMLFWAGRYALAVAKRGYRTAAVPVQVGDGTVPDGLEEKAYLAKSNCPEIAIEVTEE